MMWLIEYRDDRDPGPGSRRRTTCNLADTEDAALTNWITVHRLSMIDAEHITIVSMKPADRINHILS
jgi:hypothetical protein